MVGCWTSGALLPALDANSAWRSSAASAWHASQTLAWHVFYTLPCPSWGCVSRVKLAAVHLSAIVCCRYNASSRHYDAFFLQSLPPNVTGLPFEDQPAHGSRRMAAAMDSHAAQQRDVVRWDGTMLSQPTQAAPAGQQHDWQPSIAAAGPEVQYSVLANQTAIHGLPAAISQVGGLAVISGYLCLSCLEIQL